MDLLRVRKLAGLLEAFRLPVFVDPADVINYQGLLEFAEDFAKNGPPPDPIRSVFHEPEQFKADFSAEDVVVALMTPQNGFISPIGVNIESKSGRVISSQRPDNALWQITHNSKDLPQHEQDRLLSRYENGYQLWWFNRLNVDVYKLLKAAQLLHRDAPDRRKNRGSK